MKPIHYDDALRAMDWGLDASFLELKMNSSVLVCLCQAVVEPHGQGLTGECKKLFEWCLSTGAQMKPLELTSLFFQIAAAPNASWVWRALLDRGYPLDKVVAKVGGQGAGRTSRTTTKLGLLCSPPYCLTHELPALIALLVDRGVDPNERDSDGYAPIGRLNEQLRVHESNPVPIDVFVPAIVQGVEILLDKGAEIEGLLPSPEAFAAKAIQECVRAKKERAELLQQVIVPLAPTGEVKLGPSRVL